MTRIGTAYFERNRKLRLFADLASAGEPDQPAEMSCWDGKHDG